MEPMREDKLFAMLHGININMRKLADRALWPLGITHAEMRIMMAIYYYGDSSQEEMVCRLGVDRSNISRSLKKLENIQYIAREKDDKDGRAFRIALTEKGRSLKAELFRIRMSIQHIFSRSMTDADLDDLLKLLENVNRNLGGDPSVPLGKRG
ncbi:MAG: MarR family transcriptional regulator [Proteobacteria bacterium]|nr:MarR family transcriptional regulator [Pseudomonadota bacterium]